MTDSMKFGPEWLRNMKSDTSVVGGGGANVPSSAPTIKMAEFRYGREEMLALFDRTILPPDPLKQMQGLYVEKTQLPLALIQMTDDETRMWNRGINSDVALRLSKPGSGVGVSGVRGALGGRGGSVDRGRGRARGSYHYSRGLSYEESDTPNGYNTRSMRSYDRTQSQGNWGERNGGDPGDYTATSPRKEFGARGLSDTNWRRHRGGGEDEDGWRATRSDKWGRGSGNSWREGDGNWDRTRSWEDGTNSHPLPRKPWDNEENNLPEWATANPSESGGSFDASGAFHGGTVYSDDEDSIVNPSSNTQSEQPKSSSSQPRPAPHSKKEPPNITNGTSHTHLETGGSDSHKSSGSSPLRQSQSVTNMSSERRPTNHPITSSASFTGVNSHLSQMNSESKTQREELPSKPSRSPSHQLPNLRLKKPTEVPVVSEPKPLEKSSQEEEIEQRLLDAADVFVSRLMDEEEREPPNVPPTTTSPPTSAPAHSHTHTDTLWYYQDPQGNVQGPFQSSEMSEWFNSGYFKGTLLVRRACDERYSPLSDLIKLWKGIPFMLDYYRIPPIKNSETILPVLDDSMLLQFQIQQRLMLQRQAQQTFAKLSQTESFNNLTLDQQQILAHQALEMNLQTGLMTPHNQTPAHTNSNVLAMIHQLAQFQQLHQQQRQGSQVPVTVPVPGPSEPQLDPVQQLMRQMGLQTHSRPATTPQNTPEDQRSIEQFMNAFRQRQANPQSPHQLQPVNMESVWGGATTTPAFPAWSAPPGHPTAPQSLWADPVTKGIKTEQEILEEQLRAEEKKKEELREQEELQRLKEEEEKERLRRIKEEEDLERKRKEDEEREREKERKRLQEEEERKKKEVAAAKKAEQDRLRKEEEKKKKEEEKRKREEEKKKQEEEKRKAEEEKKILEEERKKREEMTKKQNEVLKRLQEQQQQARAVKPPPAHTPAWTPPDTSGANLVEIQKNERKKQQQLREQQEMLKTYEEKHQQEQQLKSSKSGSSLNLKWAESTKNQPTRVKSLAEIQAEEHERMAKQAEKEKAERMAAVKEVSIPATGSIWASNQPLTWNQQSASVWGTSAVSNSVSEPGACYWEEKTTKPTKPPKPALQQPAAKSQAKTKAKKEEASVIKIFEKPLSKTPKPEEFDKWCTKTLLPSANIVDIPTFVEFLWSIDSHKDLREYILLYLGEKEGNDFASEFIDRRSRLLSANKPMHRPEPTTDSTAQSNHFQEVKGKNKKVKKSKMTKVDSRILGFNVTAAPDRINVGDRDYGEGL